MYWRDFLPIPPGSAVCIWRNILVFHFVSYSINNLLFYGLLLLNWYLVFVKACIYQRLYRKYRLPRAFYCCRQLAKFRIWQGICLYNALLGPVCYKLTESCFPCCGVLGYCRFWFKIQDFIGWNEGPWSTYSWRRKKFKTRIYIIIPIFPPPIISDWRKLGWRGILKLSFLADSSQ